MKQYTYFPGCSAGSTGLGYGLSLEAVSPLLDMELLELEDWNCCGSTPYGSLEEFEAAVLVGRDLAIAEKTGHDLVTPCSSCFVTLKKNHGLFREDAALARDINTALAEAGLSYHGTVNIRHITDVLFRDITPEEVASKVKKSLKGLRVAPYYGCQIVRPQYGEEDADEPVSLDRLVAATGAEPVPFPLKTRCCGSSLMMSRQDVALRFVDDIISNAAENGAECIVTVCPLCQTNLDAFQAPAASAYGKQYNLPVLYITQLIGMALGLGLKELGLDTNIVSAAPLLKRLAEAGEEVVGGRA
ncbi:CoB--CoM heterodisulfide reductase iron-sulfur subunit B family protein [Chloroflexota bacterium]